MFLVATTSGAIWVAHVYSHGLGESIQRGTGSTARVHAIAATELPILLAAAAPTATLLLGAVGLVKESTDIAIAFGVGLAALAVQGPATRGWNGWAGRMTAIVAANLALGLFVVALKVVVNPLTSAPRRTSALEDLLLLHFELGVGEDARGLQLAERLQLLELVFLLGGGRSGACGGSGRTAVLPAAPATWPGGGRRVRHGVAVPAITAVRATPRMSGMFVAPLFEVGCV